MCRSIHTPNNPQVPTNYAPPAAFPTALASIQLLLLPRLLRPLTGAILCRRNAISSISSSIQLLLLLRLQLQLLLRLQFQFQLLCHLPCRSRFQLQHFRRLVPGVFFRWMVSFCCSLEVVRSLCWSTCLVIDRNISSTLMLSLADVSNSSMSICFAKRCASSVITTFLSGSSFLLPTRRKDR